MNFCEKFLIIFFLLCDSENDLYMPLFKIYLLFDYQFRSNLFITFLLKAKSPMCITTLFLVGVEIFYFADSET